MNKKKSIAIILVLTLLIGGLAAYFLLNNKEQTMPAGDSAGTNITADKTTPVPLNEQTTTDSASADDSSTDDNKEVVAVKEDDLVQTDGPDRNPIISSLEIKESQLIVKTDLVGIVSGRCSLVLKNGSNTVKKEAEVVYSGSGSICAGYSIAISDLGTGTWTVELSVIHDGETYSSDGKYIEI